MKIPVTYVKAYIWTIAGLFLTFSCGAPVLGPADGSTGAKLVPKSRAGPLNPSDTLNKADNIIHDGIRARVLEVDVGRKPAPPIIDHVEKNPPSRPIIVSSPSKPKGPPPSKPKTSTLLKSTISISSLSRPTISSFSTSIVSSSSKPTENNPVPTHTRAHAGHKSSKGKSKHHSPKPNGQTPDPGPDDDPLDDDDDDDDDFWGHDDGPIDEDDFVKISFWIKDSFQIRCAEPKHIFNSPIALERTRDLLPKNFSWRNFDDTPWLAEEFIREMQESCMEDCSCDDWASLHAPEARKNDSLSYCKTWEDARKCEWVFGCQCWAELGDPEIPQRFENMSVQSWASELSSLPMHIRKAHPDWRWNNGPKGWNNESLGTGFGPRTEYWETRNFWYYPRPWDVYRERILAEVQPGYYLYGPDVPWIHGNPMKELRTWKPSLRGEWELFMRYLYAVNPDRTYRPGKFWAPADPFPPLEELWRPARDALDALGGGGEDAGVNINLLLAEGGADAPAAKVRRAEEPPPEPTTAKEPGLTCIPRYLALSNTDGIERLCPLPEAEESTEEDGGKDYKGGLP
ncbi:hypothetical protein TWF506_006465 [Arthrobotrys conoides]|uniref:Uncharacterized protein n=1 Tax=Arthrobotrys conoides TaxID=74498 RepID=A0AAN8NM33_9PEZI